MQEYGADCPAPNTGRVYIAYLDSVRYLRPLQARTAVYHELMCAYLASARQRGFVGANIWACPPLVRARMRSFVWFLPLLLSNFACCTGDYVPCVVFVIASVRSCIWSFHFESIVFLLLSIFILETESKGLCSGLPLLTSCLLCSPRHLLTLIATTLTAASLLSFLSQRGDGYIFHVHPLQQRTPDKRRLRAWYIQLLAQSQAEGVVESVSQLADEYFRCVHASLCACLCVFACLFSGPESGMSFAVILGCPCRLFFVSLGVCCYTSV